jgi:16S rRNA (cytosine1402-N4)-methyltransferase
MRHTPVLHTTILDLLAPKEGDVVLDVTVGLGGHAQSFLEKIGPQGKLIGIDADEENLQEVKKVLNVAKVQNVTLLHTNFRNLQSLPHLLHLPHFSCHILFADLGVSSPHFDDARRGFSFRFDGPLDCRFDRSKGETGAELLMQANEQELLRIFKDYGELRGAKKLVYGILESRSAHPIATTQDLRRLTEAAFGWRAKSVLPQVFQALRIAVNDELGALKILLTEGPKLLKKGGRMGIMSFHSLEDRMVKQSFRELATPLKHPVTGAPISNPPFHLLTPHPITATLSEIEKNPRARSAKFRAIARVS